MPNPEKLDRFVAIIASALDEAPRPPGVLATERRLLGTVAAQCGSRLTSRFLSQLGVRLHARGLATSPSLDSKGLRRSDWIYFAKGHFPPDAMLFPRERDLVRFVSSCIGTGVFRDLRHFRTGRRASAEEFRLPDGRRVDLLCEEKTTSGPGALVALELKSDGERGVVEQLVGYMDALRVMFPDREVRGVIVTGREDQVGAKLLPAVDRYRIDWICYRVDFRTVSLD